jgi:Domain of unknown function (DUF4262)
MYEAIRKNGQQIQYVSDVNTAWAYTIGRAKRRLPELIVVGVDPASAAGMLNFVDQQFCDPDVSIFEPSNGKDPRCSTLAFLPVPGRVWDDTDYLLGAKRYAEAIDRVQERAAVQVVWADPKGRFPWEPGCDRRLAKLQTIVGLDISERRRDAS